MCGVCFWFRIGLICVFFEGFWSYNVTDGPLLKAKPDWLVTCQRDDPNLGQCLNNVLANVFPQLAIGIPEINVEKFEPLHLNRMSISKDAGPVTLSGSFINITVIGPSNSTPTYTRINIKEGRMEFGIHFPRLDIRSKYDLKGKILILPLVGSGDCRMTLLGVDTKVSTNISFIEKEGKEVLHMDSMITRYTMGGIKIHLSNLFNGNKLLGGTVNTFLNEHGLEIVQELEETVGESLSEIFLDITNNLFTKIPTELWLPDKSAKNP